MKNVLHRAFSESAFKSIWQPILEFVLLVVFALWVGQKYVNFDSNVFIEGGEFILPTISHYVWNLLFQCGSCVFWNGYLNGGAPAFIELHGAVLHPLVIISTLLLGVVNGSKLIALVSLITIGTGQWWLAKELKLRSWIRIWSALMAIVGGHVFGKLQAGNVVLLLSIASASLILPMIIRLKNAPTFRNTALTAIILALTWLSGQGYIQFVVLLAYFPAILWILVRESSPRFLLWRKFFLAFLLSILLISILLVPFLHFQDNWQKISSNKLDSIQPFGYSVLNLVIHDWQFYNDTSLEKTITPWAHINFIGWLPVLLVLLGLVFLQKSRWRKEPLFFYTTMVLALLFSSREPYVIFEDWKFITQLRSINVAASLAIQPLLMIAAVTLQELSEREWFKILVTVTLGKFLYQVNVLKWTALLVIVFLSLKTPIQYGNKFITVRPITIPSEELGLLDTDSSQWVQALNYDWIPSLLEDNKKIVIQDRPWSWIDRTQVTPFLKVLDIRGGDQIDQPVKNLGQLILVEDPSMIYASVMMGDTTYPCLSEGAGGHVSVTCSNDEAGILTVREYYWSGWHAWMDGNPVEIDQTQDFLTVSAPAGNHVYQFKYQPWDVYVGMGLTALGIFLCVALILKKPKE